jgi:ABC-type sugar transport system ATPase subunit
MGLALRLRGAPAVQRVDRVRRTAGRVDIGDLLGRRPRDLSEGERHRVGLGRAIVRRPQAFLMDERLSALDATLRVKMRASIARLHRELASTMFYVTHDQTSSSWTAPAGGVARGGDATGLRGAWLAGEVR